MAIFSIIEFANMPIIPGSLGNAVPVGRFDDKTIVQPVLTLSTSAQQSATFSANTTFIRVHNSGICSFAIGSPGLTTATTGSAGRLPADHTEFFGVQGGQVISVVTDT